MNAPNTERDNNPTVLVVEDNPDDTLLFQTASQEACPDIRFRFVRDGYETLAYLKGDGEFADRHTYPMPNVLLLDVRLPGMDGFEVLERIRRLHHCDEIKVLAWSDGPDPRILERARAAGVDHFVPKPFSFQGVLEEARRICAMARETRNHRKP